VAVSWTEGLACRSGYSLEPLSIRSQRDPVSVSSRKMNVLNAPISRELSVVVANGNSVRVCGQQLVGLNQSVVSQHTSNTCSRVGDPKLAEDAKKHPSSLR